MTACFASFAHGANDTSNAIGPFVAVYTTYVYETVENSAKVPPWILAAAGVGIVLGLAILGYRVNYISLSFSHSLSLSLFSLFSLSFCFYLSPFSLSLSLFLFEFTCQWTSFYMSNNVRYLYQLDHYEHWRQLDKNHTRTWICYGICWSDCCCDCFTAWSSHIDNPLPRSEPSTLNLQYK